MKILFISSGNSKYGISPIIRNQGQSLITQWTDVDFFMIKGKGVLSYFKHIFVLRKYLMKNKYDIIHAHYGLCGIVALLANRKGKLIVTFMGDDILGSSKSDGSFILISKLFAQFNIFLAHHFYNHIIVKSHEMMIKFGRSDCVSLIPNGVDLDKFKSVNKEEAFLRTGFSQNRKHIIFVSNPSRPEKNFALALKAYEQLDDSNMELHTVFDISNDLLPYYYSAGDLVLMTSFHEGSPNVVKEAMACNCPVVCTEVGDIKELFSNTPGYFITPYDPNVVAEKIEKALDFRNENYFTRGRERIIELGLDAENIAKKIIEVYEKVMKMNN
jgi:teichuronic acid biosynthesis glycosyltransferase TuaC